MLQAYFALAFGNLRHRGIRSWLTMLGIFIGIAAVVSLISLGQGLQEAITGQFSTLSVDRLIIQNAGTAFGPPGSAAIKKLTSHDLDIVKSVSGVDRAIPRLLRIGKVTYNKQAQFEFIVSMPQGQSDIQYLYDSFSIKAESGKLLTTSDKGKILVGKDFETNNGFEKEIRPGTILNIQGKNFQVLGILKKASSFQINSAIFMLEDDMKNLFSLKDESDFIVAQVHDKDKVEQVAEEIAHKLRKDRHEKIGEEDFSIQSPLQALGSVNTILNIINLIVTGIAAISLLVGGIGITNTMFTSVLERRKEIGTMKAVGAKNSDILLIFLIESGLLGLVGGIVGALIGLALAFSSASIANQTFGDTILSVHVSYPLLGAAIAFSFFIGIVSGVTPAIQASRLHPVEALRS